MPDANTDADSPTTSTSGTGGRRGAPQPVHDTIVVRQIVRASSARVWRAFADPVERCVWSVPAGEEMVVDHDSFRTGGRTASRCGTPGVLEFSLAGEYLDVREPARIVATETTSSGGVLLGAALLTWTFERHEEGTLVTVTVLVVSFAGRGMLGGVRAGHRIALEQLAASLAT